MSPKENIFEVGDIVTFKNHPLLYDYEIRGDGKYVPPIMLVREVLLETKQKKTHDELTGKKIAEKVKYICTYFDDNKSEFVDSHLYQTMLVSFKSLLIGRLDDSEKKNTNRIDLITEISNYPIKPDYEYGKIIYFKTKKIEVLKKRSSKKIVIDKLSSSKLEDKKILQYVVNYASPDFIISGAKKEIYTDLFYTDGKPKRYASIDFVKIQWFNPIQQKFSEQYLPLEFFTDIPPFPPKQSYV